MLDKGHDYVTIIPFDIYMLCPQTSFIGEVLVLVYSLLGKWKLLGCIWPFATPYTVPGILQARILEWVAGPFSRGSSQPRDWTQVSHTAGRFFTSWATREAPLLGRYSFQTGWVCVCVCMCVRVCACACTCSLVYMWCAHAQHHGFDLFSSVLETYIPLATHTLQLMQSCDFGA